MPIYEYGCGCGRSFEALKSIEDRHNVTCGCGRVPEIKMPRTALFIIAAPFRVLAHDGTVLHERQVIENTPPSGYRMDNPNLVEV